MNIHYYYAPTKIVFGKGAELQAGGLIKGYHYRKVLLHYGGDSARRSGLLGRVKESLAKAGLSYAELGGVVPNPQLSLVYEGIGLAKREEVDFILAVGGGSVIDSAKAIGYGVSNPGDVWDFYSGKRRAAACLPIGSVLTIAAAGSEMSNSSVITKADTGLKRSYNDDLSRPVFAIMNPELTITLPDYQTASGCVDILMHTMERYFNHGANMELTDGISETLMRTVIKNALILTADPQNYNARAEIMWAGSLSHNGLTGFGTDGGDWASHLLEHELGGMFDVAHGAGLAAIWGSWARYVCRERLDRFVKFAQNVMAIAPDADDQETAELGIRAMENFYRSVHMPTSIKELGLNPSEAQIEEMADKCYSCAGGSLGVVRPLEKEDMIAIYKMAL